MPHFCLTIKQKPFESYLILLADRHFAVYSSIWLCQANLNFKSYKFWTANVHAPNN